MSSGDAELLSRILNGNQNDPDSLIRSNPRVYIRHEERSARGKEGRTVYMKLDDPLKDGGTDLRIKGIRPRADGGEIQPYPKEGMGLSPGRSASMTMDLSWLCRRQTNPTGLF